MYFRTCMCPHVHVCLYCWKCVVTALCCCSCWIVVPCTCILPCTWPHPTVFYTLTCEPLPWQMTYTCIYICSWRLSWLIQPHTIQQASAQPRANCLKFEYPTCEVVWWESLECALPHSQGKTYYYHVITRKSQWTRPTDWDADGSVTMDLASSDEVKVRTPVVRGRQREGDEEWQRGSSREMWLCDIIYVHEVVHVTLYDNGDKRKTMYMYM